MLPATIKFLILVLGEQMQFSWCRLIGNTLIVGAEMEAAPVGAPARIVTFGSRQTRSSISPSLEKSLIRIQWPASVRCMKIVVLVLSFLIPPRLSMQDHRLRLTMHR